jgi:uncharacterized protein YqgV (UPF0045/DUF77 family)
MSNLSTVIAEISIVPIGTSDTSIGKEIAAAYDAIRNIKNLKKVTLTPIKRVISTIRIDERLDKPNTLDEKIQSVKAKVS